MATKENDSKHDETISNATGSQQINNHNEISHLGANIGSSLTNGNTILSGPEKTPAQQAEARKIGSFPVDLSNIKPIFSVKSKNSQAKERFTQRAQEYLDSHKMRIYLQDAIKIILDRREEKPIDILTD